MDACSEDPPLQVARDGRMSRCFIDMANGAEGTAAGGAGTADAATETAK
jgi:hypothetical protein